MGWVSQHAIIWFIVVASEIDILLCTQTTIELRRHLKISAAKAVWPKFVYQSVTFDRIVSVRFQIRLINIHITSIYFQCADMAKETESRLCELATYCDQNTAWTWDHATYNMVVCFISLTFRRLSAVMSARGTSPTVTYTGSRATTATSATQEALPP